MFSVLDSVETANTNLEYRQRLNEYLNSFEEYSHITWVDGVGFCCLQRYLFTWGVCLKLSYTGPEEGRYCFEDYWSARKFLEEWDGKTPPTVGKDGCTATKRKLSPQDSEVPEPIGDAEV